MKKIIIFILTFNLSLNSAHANVGSCIDDALDKLEGVKPQAPTLPTKPNVAAKTVTKPAPAKPDLDSPSDSAASSKVSKSPAQTKLESTKSKKVTVDEDSEITTKKSQANLDKDTLQAVKKGAEQIETELEESSAKKLTTKVENETSPKKLSELSADEPKKEARQNTASSEKPEAPPRLDDLTPRNRAAVDRAIESTQEARDKVLDFEKKESNNKKQTVSNQSSPNQNTPNQSAEPKLGSSSNSQPNSVPSQAGGGLSEAVVLASKPALELAEQAAKLGVKDMTQVAVKDASKGTASQVSQKVKQNATDYAQDYESSTKQPRFSVQSKDGQAGVYSNKTGNTYTVQNQNGEISAVVSNRNGSRVEFPLSRAEKQAVDLETPSVPTQITRAQADQPSGLASADLPKTAQVTANSQAVGTADNLGLRQAAGATDRAPASTKGSMTAKEWDEFEAEFGIKRDANGQVISKEEQARQALRERELELEKKYGVGAQQNKAALAQQNITPQNGVNAPATKKPASTVSRQEVDPTKVEADKAKFGRADNVETEKAILSVKEADTGLKPVAQSNVGNSSNSLNFLAEKDGFKGSRLTEAQKDFYARDLGVSGNKANAIDFKPVMSKADMNGLMKKVFPEGTTFDPQTLRQMMSFDPAKGYLNASDYLQAQKFVKAIEAKGGSNYINSLKELTAQDRVLMNRLFDRAPLYARQIAPDTPSLSRLSLTPSEPLAASKPSLQAASKVDSSISAQAAAKAEYKAEASTISRAPAQALTEDVQIVAQQKTLPEFKVEKGQILKMQGSSGAKYDAKIVGGPNASGKYEVEFNQPGVGIGRTTKTLKELEQANVTPPAIIPNPTINVPIRGKDVSYPGRVIGQKPDANGNFMVEIFEPGKPPTVVKRSEAELKLANANSIKSEAVKLDPAKPEPVKLDSVRPLSSQSAVLPKDTSNQLLLLAEKQNLKAQRLTTAQKESASLDLGVYGNKAEAIDFKPIASKSEMKSLTTKLFPEGQPGFDPQRIRQMLSFDPTKGYVDRADFAEAQKFMKAIEAKGGIKAIDELNLSKGERETLNKIFERLPYYAREVEPNTTRLGKLTTDVEIINRGPASAFPPSEQAQKFAQSMKASNRVQDLETAGKLSNSDRLFAAETILERPLSIQQRKALLQAHEIGEGFGKYTPEEITQKRSLLKEAGFSRAESEILLWKGVAGKSPAPVKSQLDIVQKLPESGNKSRLLAEIEMSKNAGVVNSVSLQKFKESSAQFQKELKEYRGQPSVRDYQMLEDATAFWGAHAQSPQDIAQAKEVFVKAFEARVRAAAQTDKRFNDGNYVSDWVQTWKYDQGRGGFKTANDWKAKTIIEYYNTKKGWNLR